MEYTVEQIREKVGSDKKWAGRALEVLYARQTADEQRSHTTKHHNKMGFTGWDAEMLTSFAEQFMARGTLSAKQWRVAFKRLPKYAKQLHYVAYGREREKVAAVLQEVAL